MAVKSEKPRPSAGKPGRVGRSAGRPRNDSQSVGREALIEVTCELLKSQPPSAVTRALVARHSNVDPSLIRYYFKDRDSLMVAAAESIIARFRTIVAAAYARTDNSPRNRLVARIGALLELDALYPYFNRLLNEELIRSESPEAKRMARDLQTTAIGAYTELVEAGVRQGEFRPIDPAQLYVSVLGLCEFVNQGRATIEVVQGAPLSPAEYAEKHKTFICDLILQGIQAPAATPSGVLTADADAMPANDETLERGGRGRSKRKAAD